MALRRYLCSHLVTLSWSGGSRVVNLEEIWETGAVLDAEEAINPGVIVEIRTGHVYFDGRLTDVREHAFGWNLEIRFSPLTLWSPERFRPEHLLDLAALPYPEN